jgi:hypothetical protein
MTKLPLREVRSQPSSVIPERKRMFTAQRAHNLIRLKGNVEDPGGEAFSAG